MCVVCVMCLWCLCVGRVGEWCVCGVCSRGVSNVCVVHVCVGEQGPSLLRQFVCVGLVETAEPHEQHPITSSVLHHPSIPGEGGA